MVFKVGELAKKNNLSISDQVLYGDNNSINISNKDIKNANIINKDSLDSIEEEKIPLTITTDFYNFSSQVEKQNIFFYNNEASLMNAFNNVNGHDGWSNIMLHSKINTLYSETIKAANNGKFVLGDLLTISDRGINPTNKFKVYLSDDGVNFTEVYYNDTDRNGNYRHVLSGTGKYLRITALSATAGYSRIVFAKNSIFFEGHIEY